MTAYPAQHDVDVVLKDGSTLHIRPILPTDREALQRFLEALSEQSRVFRFFTAVRDLGWAAARFTDVDYRDRHGLVALRGPEEEIVGHGFYSVSAPGRAEVALEVADALQGMGVGTILLGHLAQAASAAGITEFEAEVMAENHRMLKVFRDSGFHLRTHSGRGVISLEFPTSLTEEAREQFERREQSSAIAALRRFFEPRSVAVIGASRRRGTFGGEVFHNLLISGFDGAVAPVSPHPVVQSVVGYPDVREVPGDVDLAVIAVPAADVVRVARECAEKGVRALVVVSAGFAETGAEGRARQDELVAVCREWGMRLIGPNCMGIINTDPRHSLNATFAPAFPPAGNAGFLSQSGGLGLAVIDRARSLGLGISTFVSNGNKADISGNDLLEYWLADERTSLILLYLESFGNPRRFSRIARRVSREKPILAVKGGRTGAGARAAGSHTGALLAASDVTVDALFRQSGVIRTDTLGELFDAASLLANQPPPAGSRVGILTNAGGPGILCVDACVAAGLEVPPLPEATRLELAAFLPAEAGLGNPVDMIASAPPAAYEQAIGALGGCAELDALIVIFIPPLTFSPQEVAAAIRRGVAGLKRDKPALAVFMSAQGVPPELSDGDARIPSYAFPEDAARALARVTAWASWRNRPEQPAPAFSDVRRDEASAVTATALGAGPGWLDAAGTARLLDCYGIRVAPWRMVASPEEAPAAAAELGCPVALKAIAPTVLHKSEAGAVALSLDGARAVRTAARDMAGRLRAAGHELTGLLVQAMVPAGVDMIVGVVQDPLFGPVVACGAGGTAVELLKDVEVRLSPLSTADAEEMIRGLATYPLLDGYRGRPRADVPALRDMLLRVSAMVEAHEEIAELDLNPVMVSPEGAVAVDARVRLEHLPPRSPEGSRPRPAGPGPDGTSKG